MAVGRFERKIVAAILAVALMPLAGALVLGLRALREAYAVGVNEQVEGELERGLSLYRTHFEALRADAERTVDAIAHDHALNEAAHRSEQAALIRALDDVLLRYENVVSIALKSPNGSLERARKGVKLDELRPLELELPLASNASDSVHVVVGASASTFGDYQRAGELGEVFRTLKDSSNYVSGFYLAVYIALLLSVIVVALGIGLTLSRKVTRRVTQLAEATERVGAGDLTVHVPVTELDEVAELTRAFNDMVRDMRESRERIDYLSRIGAWQEFARRLAHEIKNPLTPIQLAVQEVHRSYKGDDARFRRLLEDARSIVEEEIATLRRLVGEFSEFARLPEVHLAPADLGVFVREAVEAPFRGDESDEDVPHVEVRAVVPDRALPVHIDVMLLKRCLDNLIRNAAQAIRGAGKSGHVVVEARLESTRALLEVRDDGPGVPDTARERVFDPYYTTKSEGTGLGLAIVKKIVLEHGGEIACLRAPEGGACFRIELPSREHPPRLSRPGGRS
jgi:two-component system, NtrC family, nitrogen regulation sensor histidine kinase NtrY